MTSGAHTVLCVDDEPNILNALKRLLRREDYRLITVGSAEEGLALLALQPVHVVLSDQRMPGINGTEFLARVRERYPDVLRIILSGYMDVDAITEAVNKGHVYKFFLKPWNDQNLKLEIRQALDQYDLMQANRRLTEELQQKNEELRHINQNLEAMVRERTEILELQNRTLELSHAVLDELPLPVAAISAEGMIVMLNRRMREIAAEGLKLSVGAHVGDGALAPVGERLPTVLRSQGPQCLPPRSLGCGNWGVEILPLRGVLRERGVIVALTPKIAPTERD